MTERWVKMVEKEYKRGCVGRERKAWLDKADVVKLLARQHRAVVRKIKSLPTYDPAATVSGMQRIDQGQWVRLDTVLAALAKQGARKKD